MDCSGNESTLLMCKGSGTGNGCSHDDDAGVTCRDESEPSYSLLCIIYLMYSSHRNSIPLLHLEPVCTDGDLILADGHSPNEGRVEVCTGGWFRTVCDIDWDNQDAAVVCKQLGYQGEGDITTSLLVLSNLLSLPIDKLATQYLATHVILSFCDILYCTFTISGVHFWFKQQLLL